MKILMVCIGNICRSPIAEGILQHKADQAKLGWQVDSAAVKPYHIGEPPHPDSVRVCRENGIDISGQRAMLFTEKHMHSYDQIYVMAEDVMDHIITSIGAQHLEIEKLNYFMELDPEARDRNLLDPWYGNYDGYELVYDTIDRLTDILIADQDIDSKG